NIFPDGFPPSVRNAREWRAAGNALFKYLSRDSPNRQEVFYLRIERLVALFPTGVILNAFENGGRRRPLLRPDTSKADVSREVRNDALAPRPGHDWKERRGNTGLWATTKFDY